MYIVTPIVSIEITRRCNLNCAHCMRGNAENMVISEELLEKFFDEVKSANELVISGGEPFLCYEQIKSLVEIMKKKKVMIPSVQIITNGTIYDERIYTLLEDNFQDFSVYISLDEYHIRSIESIYSIDKTSTSPRLAPMNCEEVIKNIELHRKNKHYKGIHGSPKYLFDSGRARLLDKPKMPLNPLGYFYSDCMDGVLIVGPRIYLDCQGYITEGDSEYDSRDTLSIGNLHDDTLSDMVLKNAIKIGVSTGEEFNDFRLQREKDYATLNSLKSYAYVDHKIVEKSEEPAPASLTFRPNNL